MHFGPSSPAAEASSMPEPLLLLLVVAAAALPAKPAAGSARVPSNRLRMYTLQQAGGSRRQQAGIRYDYLSTHMLKFCGCKRDLLQLHYGPI
jgi:hypothetical protein